LRANRFFETATCRGAVVAATALFATSFLSACGNPTQPLADCVGLPDDVLQVIQQRVTVDAELRNGKIVELDGAPYVFVSAEVHPVSADPHSSGDIATWAVSDVDTEEFLAVDVVARDQSSWPAAPFNVTEVGAIESRACTDLSRGKTPAQVECEREANDRSIPLPDGKQCSDL
jgi:hypothetical protein